MKLTVDAGVLLDQVQAVMPAIAARTTKPVLSSIHVRAEGDTLSVSATDNEVAVTRTALSASIQQSGVACLAPGRLVGILRELDGEVAVSADGGGVTVRHGKKDRWELPGENPDEFPAVPEPGLDCAQLTLTAGELRRLFRSTIYAAPRKETAARFTVSLARWEVEDGVLRVICTDTRRLAVASATLAGAAVPAECATPVVAMVPLKFVSTLERNLGDDGEEVTLHVSKNEVWAATATTRVWGRQAVGTFPPWRKIIPAKFTGSLSVPAEELAKVVRQAAVTSDDERKRVEVQIKGGLMTLAAAGPESGKSEVEFAVQHDGDVSFAVDPQYLLEALKAYSGQTVQLHWIDGGKPLLVSADAETRCLVMPMEMEK